jgi:hypothetical protein
MTTNDHRPGFSRFGWGVLVIIILASILAAVLSGCNPEAKQQRKYDKLCKEAEALVAKAVFMCPGILEAKVTHDTVTVYTKAEARLGERLYTQYYMDSLFVYLQANAKNNIDTVEVIRWITKYACTFDTIRETTDKHALLIWPKPKGVGWWINDFPQRVDTVIVKSESSVSTTPAVPKDSPRVRSWGWLWAVLMFCVGFIASSFIKGSHRHEP